MWCLLCKISFTEHELFKCHILEKHRPDSEFYKGSDTDKEESEQETRDIETEEEDTEIHNEDSTGSSVDAAQLSFDINTNESPSKSTSTFSSKNPLTYGLRRSNRLRTAIPKSKSFSSQLNFDTFRNKDYKRANNLTKSAANNQACDNTVVSQALVQQPVIVYPFNSNISQMNADVGFELNSKNIREWLTKHKNLCKNVSYPLPLHLYEKIQLIHKEIVSQYSMASPSEQNTAIFKVFEDLNNMILKHIECVYNQLDD